MKWRKIKAPKKKTWRKGLISVIRFRGMGHKAITRFIPFCLLSWSEKTLSKPFTRRMLLWERKIELRRRR